MKHVRILTLFSMLSLLWVPTLTVHAEQGLPETAVAILDINTFVDWIPDSLSWKAIDYFEEGWFERQHDVSGWAPVVFLPLLYPGGNARFSSELIYHPDLYAADAYIRGIFGGIEAETRIRKAYVKVVADNDFDLYVNDTFVGSESDGAVGPLQVFDVTPYWRTNAADGNVVAVHVINPTGPGSLYVTARVYYTP